MISLLLLSRLLAIVRAEQRTPTPGAHAPLRSRAYLWGWPWLRGKLRQNIDDANALFHITWEACNLAFSLGIPYLVEHPEDLGRTASGEQPGSLWLMEPTRDLVEKTGAYTGALFPVR